MDKFRILSLDGGGSWALIQVMALQALYPKDTTGHAVLKDFDLVAANSGGSIVLGGLIENLTLRDLQGHFLDEARRRLIFPPVSPAEKVEFEIYKMLGFSPKYSTDNKLSGLKKLLPGFGSLKMPDVAGRIESSVDSCPRLMICAFDYDRKRAAFFRSYPAKPVGSASASDPTLAQAINASSTAPVRFFDAPATIDQSRYWDGAVGGHNNPVLCAVIDALALPVPREDIQVLSIGTGAVRLPIAEKGGDASSVMQPRKDPTVRADIKLLAECIVDDPPDSASYHVHMVLGQDLARAPTSGPIVRMNPMVQPIHFDGEWRIPDGLTETDFYDLTRLEMDAVEQEDVEKIHKLGVAWLSDRVVNQPICHRFDDFGCIIGHAKFSQALAAWQKLRQADRTERGSARLNGSRPASPPLMNGTAPEGATAAKMPPVEWL
jgi:uncharacterized protein